MKQMLTFSVARAIDVPPDTVWQVLGDFGTEHRWVSNLRRCERDTPEVRVGTARSCTLRRPLMGRTEVRETLTEFEPGRALTYLLDGAAGPFATASSRWSTAPDRANGTLVSVEGQLAPKNVAVRLLVWPLAQLMMKRATKNVLRELDAFLSSSSSTGGGAPGGANIRS